jgi:hypothetical protein
VETRGDWSATREDSPRAGGRASRAGAALIVNRHDSKESTRDRGMGDSRDRGVGGSRDRSLGYLLATTAPAGSTARVRGPRSPRDGAGGASGALALVREGRGGWQPSFGGFFDGLASDGSVDLRALPVERAEAESLRVRPAAVDERVPVWPAAVWHASIGLFEARRVDVGSVQVRSELLPGRCVHRYAVHIQHAGIGLLHEVRRVDLRRLRA